MTRFRRTARLDAPLDRVWSFHSTVDGLTAVTPGWLGLRVDEVRDDAGEPRPHGATLVEGTEIDLSMRPLGVGPRQRWTSRIVERKRADGEAVFRDEMITGPFERWTHTHRFECDGDGTRMIDDVGYELGGALRSATPLLRLGLAPMFGYRHRRTRSLLE